MSLFKIDKKTSRKDAKDAKNRGEELLGKRYNYLYIKYLWIFLADGGHFVTLRFLAIFASLREEKRSFG